jgi:hypothetical protein
MSVANFMMATLALGPCSEPNVEKAKLVFGYWSLADPFLV